MQGGGYLNDHLAGATIGTELAQRIAGSRQEAGDGETLRRLAGDISGDRQALLAVMGALGVPVRQYKAGAAWVAEKAGRLKLNGHLQTRSPLSSLEELELLRLGVEGKAAGCCTGRPSRDAARVRRRGAPRRGRDCQNASQMLTRAGRRCRREPAFGPRMRVRRPRR